LFTLQSTQYADFDLKCTKNVQQPGSVRTHGDAYALPRPLAVEKRGKREERWWRRGERRERGKSERGKSKGRILIGDWPMSCPNLYFAEDVGSLWVRWGGMGARPMMHYNKPSNYKDQNGRRDVWRRPMQCSAIATFAVSFSSPLHLGFRHFVP